MEKSLPTRERGLKPQSLRNSRRHLVVAPHAGAWIETPTNEITNILTLVAPHAGAWIETICSKQMKMRSTSLPTRERGLKLESNIKLDMDKSRSPRGSVD